MFHQPRVKLPAALVFTVVLTGAFAQTPPCTGPFPDRVYGTYGMDVVTNAIAASDGNVFVAGSIAADGGNVGPTRYGGRDAILLKLEPDGDLIWSIVLGGPDDDELRDLMAWPDGGCIAMGSSGDAHGWRLRVSPAGTLMWQWFPFERAGIFGLFGGYVHTTNNLLIDPAFGGLISTGDIPPNPDLDFGIRRRSPDGGFIGARTLFSFDVTGIWSAYPTYLGSGEDIGLVKTNAAGTLLWVKRIQSPSIDGLIEMIVLSDGYLLLSRSFGSIAGGDRLSPIRGLHDFWVIRTDLDGNILWERSYGSFNDDLTYGMIQDTDGNFILFGRTEMAPTFDVTEPLRSTTTIGLDGWMIKIDGAGNKLWDKRWGGGETDRIHGAVPVAGGYLVVGTTESDPGYDRIVPRLNSSDIWALRMLPGTQATWYSDTDADGYGDPGASITTCAPPSGHVANGLDCNPAVPNPTNNYIGALCDDGNYFTFPDRISPGCACSGSIPDFLFDNLIFHLTPDAFAGTLSMSIFRSGSAVPLMSFGPWPGAQAGVPIVEQFQLPPGRYTMRVYDAMADGITNGGFTLSVNGRRVIDADGAFLQTSESPQGFELPIGPRSLTIGTCDELDLLPTSNIIADPDPLVSERYDRANATTGYQFWIFDPHGGYSRRIFKSHKEPGQGQPPGPAACAHLRLSSLVTNPVPMFKLLNVRVRSMVDGIYGPFGPACRIKVDPYAQVCPTTQLVDLPGDPNYSCGAQRSFGGSHKVVAYAVGGANRYQFEFVEPVSGYIRRIANSTNARLLNWFTQQPLCGTFTYQVRVRVSFDNGQTWCPWGATCPVTIAHYGAGCTPVGGSLRSFAEGPAGGISLFPNPVCDHRFTLVLPRANDDRSVMLTLFDVYGSQAFRQEVGMTAGGTSMAVDLPSAIAPGTYALEVAGEVDRWTTRLIVQ